MHGDFSLNPTFWRDRVSRVLYQMGRVQLDSDANEQTESTLHFLRALGADVIGAHGGVDSAFKIVPDAKNDAKVPFRIAWGYYYVDGIRCVNLPPDIDLWEVLGDKDAQKKLENGLNVVEHPDSFWPTKESGEGEGEANRKGRLLYLAVWERHISSAEDDSIREIALGGPDTASRAVVVWQIRSMPLEPVMTLANKLDVPPYDPIYLALNLTLRSSARLKAHAIESTNVDPCTVSPEAKYRGPENRLYRVEIHEATKDVVTFKWSQDNGAIVYPIREADGKTLHLDSLGRDERTAIRKNDWVEIVDDELTLRRIANPLLQVVDVDRHRMTVTLSDPPKNDAGSDAKRHPILRRWSGDVQMLKENQWIELSDGVEVQFSRVTSPAGGYRTGDYWLIPTRTATGDVIWPGEPDAPVALAPHGVDEHYAPLAQWNTVATGGVGGGTFKDLRYTFDPIAKKVT